MKKRRKEGVERLLFLESDLGPEVVAGSMLDLARGSFERSNNPYYAWYAIDVCIKYKMQLPNWLMPYLAQCSERMLSKTARQTRDLQKHLPWILGFPKKRGPGYLLDPDRAQQKTEFAFHFAAQIMMGHDPVTARRNATEVLDEVIDDRTLMRWLLKEFNLKKAPANTEQWKSTLIKQGWHRRGMDQNFRRLHFLRTESRETPP